MKAHFSYFFLISTLLSLLTLGGLSGCSNQPTPSEDLKQATSEMADKNKISTIASTENLEALLAAEREAAKQVQDWLTYLEKTEQLWQQIPEAEQFLLEQSTWETLSELSEADWQQISTNPHPLFQDWFTLKQITSLSGLQQQAELTNLADFAADASFTHHLIPHLKTRLSEQPSTAHIAVLLPFKGVYAEIAQQIRNGMIKYQLSHAPESKLRFYNVESPQKVTQTFLNAVEQGAQTIVGPLTKEAIATLSQAYPTLPETAQQVTVLALNQVENTPFKMFNFKSEFEPLQITEALNQQNIQHLGILSSTASSNAELATQLQALWQAMPHNQATLKTYPTKKPNLRKALGSLINEDASQARQNNLRWLLKQKMEFTPRTRQDLEAIVLVGNSRNLAVFKPQFEFFDLHLPIYGTSNITPKRLLNEPPEKDLANIRFPTFPAAIFSSNTDSVFEAYGWDALFLAAYPNQFAQGLCNYSGLTGALVATENGYDRLFTWAQYDQNGLAKPYPSPALDSPSDELTQ